MDQPEPLDKGGLAVMSSQYAADSPSERKKRDLKLCPECGESFTVRLDGRMRHHLVPNSLDAGAFRSGCPGSGQRPQDPNRW